MISPLPSQILEDAAQYMEVMLKMVPWFYEATTREHVKRHTEALRELAKKLKGEAGQGPDLSA